MSIAPGSFHSDRFRSGMATHGHVSSAVSQRCYSLGRCRRSGFAIPIPDAGPAVSGGGRFSYAFAVVARQFHRSFPHSSLPRSPGIRRAGVCRRAGAHSRSPATCPGGNPVLARGPRGARLCLEGTPFPALRVCDARAAGHALRSPVRRVRFPIRSCRYCVCGFHFSHVGFLPGWPRGAGPFARVLRGFSWFVRIGGVAWSLDVAIMTGSEGQSHD